MKNKINRNWYLIDVKDKILGRISSEISKILQGKNLSNYDPSKDMGGQVVVINASEIKLTGKKSEQKEYLRHTGFMGGIKKNSFKELIKINPEEIIKKSVWNMLPKNRLRSKRILRLRIYPTSEHPHKEQKFKEI